MKIAVIGILLGAFVVCGCQTSLPVSNDEKIDALSGLKTPPRSGDPTETLDDIAEREREENRREILRSVSDPALAPVTPQEL